MKKTLVMLFLALVSLGQVHAQQPNELQQLLGPVAPDTELRTGQLANGLTYYVRHNEKPKGQADFYIVHNVGAIQEEDSQQGLAHFLEHMAFNGTRNLPKKQLTEYLEKVGVKFGTNLNAATSWDQTTYHMTDVPTLREGVIDSALLILHDWSNFIALEPEEIDSERGVIMEELRTRDDANWRSTINLIQTLGRGTRYEHRNLIGYLDGLQHFQHDELVDFYHRWYRPDYQAIIVVGDVDADAVVAKLEKLMNDIPAPASDAPQKEVIRVADNQEPIVSIFTDKELQHTVARLSIKHAAAPRQLHNTGMYELCDILYTLICNMANNRLSDLAMKPDAPFLAASMGHGSVGIIPTLECTTFAVQTEDTRLNEGLEALLLEVEKLRRYGFTDGELDRAKQDLMRSSERSYTTRNDRRNSSFVRSYISNYLKNDIIPDAATRRHLDSVLIAQVNLDQVNGTCAQLIRTDNRVLVVNAPSKDEVVAPDAETLKALMQRTSEATVEAHEDNLVIEPLLPTDTKLKGSAVKHTSFDERYGTTTWTLKNGVRIVVKPTTFKSDEIRMSGWANGGLSLLTDDEYDAGKLLEPLLEFSGVDRFSANDLQKQLTGKVVEASLSVNEYSTGIHASCSPQDLETMLQLIYLEQTSPRWSEEDFLTLRKMVLAQLENASADPSYTLQERYLKLLYNDNPRRRQLTPERVAQLSFDTMPTLFNKLFPGIKGYTFVFVGNIDLDTLRPLVERYIGSIPTGKQTPHYRDDQIRPITGNHLDEFRIAMQQPKVSVYYTFTGEMDYTLHNRLAMTFLAQALNARYLETIREEKGGTYGVHCSGSVSGTPYNNYSFQIVFDTNDAMADELRQLIRTELTRICDEGPRAEDIEKTRQYLLKTWETGLELNGNWLSFIQNRERYGTDYLADYKPTLQQLSTDDIRALMRRILADGNCVEMVMRPELSAPAE